MFPVARWILLDVAISVLQLIQYVPDNPAFFLNAFSPYKANERSHGVCTSLSTPRLSFLGGLASVLEVQHIAFRQLPTRSR